MPTTRTLLVTAVVVLLLTVSGCSALQSGSSVNTDYVVNQTQQSMQNVETFTFDAQISTTNPQSSQTQNISAAGAVDIPDGEARAQVDIPRQPLTVYFVNETLYMKLQGTWIKQTVPNATGTAAPSTQPMVTPQAGQFMNATSVSFEGNTTINGTDVYELSVDIDESTLMNATQQGGMASMSAVGKGSYTLYVTHGTYRLKRLTSETTMPFQGQSVDANVEITLGNFDGNVTIDLPDAAKNAQTMG